MLGLGLSIGNAGTKPRESGEAPPAEGMTITVGDIAETATHFGFTDGSQGVGAVGAVDGDIAGLVPVYCWTINSTLDQMQIAFAGDVRSTLEGLNLAVDGVTRWEPIADGVNMQFSAGNTLVLRVITADELWDADVGQDHVFTVV